MNFDFAYRRRMIRLVQIACISLMVTACNEKPPHYLVLCDEKDGNQWTLVDVVKKNGYIMSCTYRSPDQSQRYTRACDSEGCNFI